MTVPPIPAMRRAFENRSVYHAASFSLLFGPGKWSYGVEA